MVIANPIYDEVFKRLMGNQLIAKFFIETLLEETIEFLEFKPQEFTFEDQVAGIGVFRVDFIATIKTTEGGYKKVLIEIQKAKHAIDIMRFRKYLAEQYKSEDEIQTETGRKKVILPIVTIYMLGFQLPEIKAAAVKVSRQYVDIATHKVIDQKNEFIEKLTHDSFVVQMPRIHGKLQTRLDELLSIFEQNFFVGENGIIKRYDHPIDNEIIKSMVDMLHYAGTDPESRKRIEDEQEAYRVLDFMAEEKTQKLQVKIDELAKELTEKDKEIAELKRMLDKNNQ
jgi:hypothetical protein